MSAQVMPSMLATFLPVKAIPRADLTTYYGLGERCRAKSAESCKLRRRQGFRTFLLGRMDNQKIVVNAGLAARFSTSWVLSAGVFLLGAAMVALALATIPLLLELRRTAKRMQSLAQTLEQEIPETAATMRLTGLEMSDAIQEVSLLSLDLTTGLQASARMLQGVERGFRESKDFLLAANAQTLLPALKKRVPTARGQLEEILIRNGDLPHNGLALLQLVTAAKTGAKRVRAALGTVQTLKTASILLPRYEER